MKKKLEISENEESLKWGRIQPNYILSVASGKEITATRKSLVINTPGISV